LSRILVLLGLIILGVASSQVWLNIASGEHSRSFTLVEAYDELYEPLSENHSEALWSTLMYYSLAVLPIGGLVATVGLLFRRVAAPGGALIAIAAAMWVASVYLMTRDAPEGFTASIGAGPLIALAGGVVAAAGGRGGGKREEAARAPRRTRSIRRGGGGGGSYIHEHHYYHHYMDERYGSGYAEGEDATGERGAGSGRSGGSLKAAAAGAAAGYAAAKAAEELGGREDEGSSEDSVEQHGFLEDVLGREDTGAEARVDEEEEVEENNVEEEEGILEDVLGDDGGSEEGDEDEE
jgi:hypothetical protein